MGKFQYPLYIIPYPCQNARRKGKPCRWDWLIAAARRRERGSKKTERREYDRLLDIRDNYPKYVLRTDDFVGGNYEGIHRMHVADFLLSDML